MIRFRLALLSLLVCGMIYASVSLFAQQEPDDTCCTAQSDCFGGTVCCPGKSLCAGLGSCMLACEPGGAVH